MKDIYRKNRRSNQPMAIRSAEAVEFTEVLNYFWMDRLITSLYIVLSVSLTVISLALMLGITI
ncbi:MAG: hypothetical protein ACJ0G1_03330 [Gammaproteobacteria bacterium]|nr:hypothetical protein [Gammaproteobacteria bacterium]|tara:strand:- start:4202 stop:4390 length:189 start_codon:yes stop_codon:yes gene_type:complete